MTFTFTADFGNITVGEQVSFSVAGNENARAFLPVEAAGATVLAVDGHGRPALLGGQIGTGSVVLCTYPVEPWPRARRGEPGERLAALRRPRGGCRRAAPGGGQ